MLWQRCVFGIVALFGGPVGLIAGAAVLLVVGIGTLAYGKYLEESGIKQQFKDDNYAAHHSNGR